MLSEIKEVTDTSHQQKSYYDLVRKSYTERFTNIQKNVDEFSLRDNYNASQENNDNTVKYHNFGSKKKNLQNSRLHDYVVYPLGINKGKIASQIKIF